jgi:predicted amidophosphoribosyltransferase
MMEVIEKIFGLFFPPFPEVANTVSSSEQEMMEHRLIHFDPELCSISVFDYADRIGRSLVWSIKYRNSRAAADKAAYILYPYIMKLISFYGQTVEKSDYKPIFLVPIPAHKGRKKKRGFSQTELIVSALIAIQSKKSFLSGEHLLKKTVRTKNQHELTHKKERLDNLIGSFSAPYPDMIKDARIILIDDVITTGSTIKAARDALLPHGPRYILAASIARQRLKSEKM